MTRIIDSLAMLVALLVSASVSSSTFAAAGIKLRERVASHTSVVRLGDVAEITTADRQQALQLAALPLMPAPAPGTERFLRTREIQDMLAAQGVEAGDLRFGGAEQVAITASNGPGVSGNSSSPSSERIAPMNRHAAILAGAIGERPAMQLDETRANVLRKQLTSIIAKYVSAKTGRGEAWRIECDIAARELGRFDAATSTPVCAGGSEPWTGRQRFLVSFSTSDGPVQLSIFAQVSPPPVPAVVAVRPIARGDVIRAADVELRTVDSNTKSTGQRVAIDSVERLIGMEARQSIQSGDVVFTDQVQAPILVKRGDVITVTSQSGGIRVRTSARALHDGAHGDLVQVESLASKEKFDARVVGPREAAVFAISRPTVPQSPQRVDTARR